MFKNLFENQILASPGNFFLHKDFKSVPGFIRNPCAKESTRQGKDTTIKIRDLTQVKFEDISGGKSIFPGQ